MYCYNCATSADTVTKTYTTTNVSDVPTSDYAKSGNGSAKITMISANSYQAYYGGNYETLPTPSKEGYEFAGWYTEPNGKGTLATEGSKILIGKDHTLYANWTPKVEYTSPGSYTYTIPHTGLYKLETWGAQGVGTKKERLISPLKKSTEPLMLLLL